MRVCNQIYYFHTQTHEILATTNIGSIITDMKNEIMHKFSNFNARRSKLRFDRVIRIDIQSDRSNPLHGGTWLGLPNFIKNKRCCINVKNNQTNKFRCERQENFRCFEYALETILNPVKKDTNSPSKYIITKYEDLEMTYPVAITKENIEKYEEFLKISINVYNIIEDESKIYIELHYKSYNFGLKKKHVNLLLYKDHEVSTKNISSLLNGQIHHRDRHMHICYKCHSTFEKQKNFNEINYQCIF